MSNDVISKSWFCVFNNPEEHGYQGSPQDIVDRLCEEWTSEHPTRSGAWIYCISADGLKHVHMVLEDRKAMRFSVIKKSYAVGMHFEPTRGNKDQAEDYINKRGRFQEKGEQIVASTRCGEIKARQGQRADLDIVRQLIEAGNTPDEIFDTDISFRRFDSMIIADFRSFRKKQVGIERNVNVVWHVGKSGSGKSHTFIDLIKEKGRNSVYFMTDYENGGFDNYMCQPVLFMDEYRGQFPYSTLLSLLDCYVSEHHARYQNISTLWDEVHITSVYAPDEIFKRCVHDPETDSFDQLKRRINTIVYHWKSGDDFHQFALPMDQYTNVCDLAFSAAGSSHTFVPAPAPVSRMFEKKREVV